MTFDELLAQVLELLQREGRVSYRASSGGITWQEYLEDLKPKSIQAKKLAMTRRHCAGLGLESQR